MKERKGDMVVGGKERRSRWSQRDESEATSSSAVRRCQALASGCHSAGTRAMISRRSQMVPHEGFG